MKYLIINGSPRKKNTWKIVNQVKKSLDGDFEEIHLAKEDIPLCKGCHNCVINGEEYCPHNEKIEGIIDKIRDCDGLIITSPVYAMNVTGLLKNFIDHTAYLYHRPEFFTKKALVVVSTAGAGNKDVSKYIDETLRHWGVNKVYKISFACGGKDKLETGKIDKIANKFNSDVKSKKLHSPKLIDIIFFNAWKVMNKGDAPIKVDKEYWVKNDLINNDFSPEVKLGIFKTLFSKIMYNFFKIIF